MNFKAICTECQDYLQVQRNDEGKVETTCKCGIKKHDNPYNVAAYLIFSSALEEGCYFLNKEYDIIKKYSLSELADETIQKEVRNIFTVDDANFKEKIFGFPPIPFKVNTKELLKNYLDVRRINVILNNFSLSSVVNLNKIWVQEIVPAYDGFFVKQHYLTCTVASLDGFYRNDDPNTERQGIYSIFI